MTGKRHRNYQKKQLLRLLSLGEWLDPRRLTEQSLGGVTLAQADVSLKALYRDGLITSRVGEDGQGGFAFFYKITAAGIKAYRQAEGLPPLPAPETP
jgi:hypothetical protein